MDDKLKTWDDIRRRALTCVYLHGLVELVERRGQDREAMLIHFAVAMSEETERLQARVVELAMMQPAQPIVLDGKLYTPKRMD